MASVVVVGQDRDRVDLDAFLLQLSHLVRRRLAVDAARRHLLVVNAPRLLGKLLDAIPS